MVLIVWFMKSTPNIDSAPSRNPLLWRINTCPAIHKFLDEVCANVWVLLHEYAMYEAVQRQNAWQGVVDPELYCAVLKTQLRLCTSASPYRSGSVFPEDVPEVLAKGNIRERCHVLYTLLGRRSHLWVYLASTPRDNSPLVISQQSALLHLHTDTVFCNGALLRAPKVKSSTAQVLGGQTRCEKPARLPCYASVLVLMLRLV